MAPPVYTEVLWDSGYLGVGITDGPGPPDGFRWVVTDVDAVFEPVVWYLPDGGFEFGQADSPAFFRRQYPAFGNVTHPWRGRQAIDFPNTLAANCADGGWSFRATGFLLSLP